MRDIDTSSSTHAAAEAAEDAAVRRDATAADPNALSPEHPFYLQLSALRAWAEGEVARAAAGGERTLDRDSLKAVLDDPGFGGSRWGIDLDAASDAELIGQIELADESMRLAPALIKGLEDIKAGRVVELEIPDEFGEDD